MTEPLAAMMQKMQEHFGQVDETVLVVLIGQIAGSQQRLRRRLLRPPL